MTLVSEEFYVCAGICRIGPETSTCIGCGRPVVELRMRGATIVEKMPHEMTGADLGDKAS